MSQVRFPAVSAILDGIMKSWTTGNGGPANFTRASTHGSKFDWSTKAGLLASSAQGLPMIQSAIIGQAGMGHTANIVLALTVGAPKPGGGRYHQMPEGGLDSNSGVYLALDSAEIKTLIAWIEGGCLE